MLEVKEKNNNFKKNIFKTKKQTDCKSNMFHRVA
jgi:hypothetical protein